MNATPCRFSNGYAKYIGRVGALAVALGIGTAMATSPVIAHAAPDSETSSSSTGDSDATDSTTATSSSADSPSDSTDTTGTQTTTSTGTTTAPNSPSATTVADTTGPDVIITSSGGAHTSTDDSDAGTTSSDGDTSSATTTSAPPPMAADEVPPTQQPSNHPVQSNPIAPVRTAQQSEPESEPSTITKQHPPTSRVSGATQVAEPDPLPTTVDDIAPSARFALAASDVQGDAAPMSALGAARQQTPPSPPAPHPVKSLLAIPGTLINIAAGLIGSVVAPLLTPGPDAPVESPLLWAVLGWVRRQSTQGFARNTPVPDVLQTTEIQPLAAAAAQGGLPEEFERTSIVSGLSQPVAFRFLPDDRILIAEKGGAIKIFHDDHVHTAITLPTATAAERGVGGIGVDPNFASTGYIYVSYTTAANRDRLSRFKLTGDTIDPGSERVLMQSPQNAGNLHHAGDIHFGRDGMLYWSMGDNTLNTNSQDLSNMHGKILRLNPEDGSAPADNPFVNQPGVLPQIYAYGFRNPFRFTITPDDKLLVADVGGAAWEELNLVTPGANYGWPVAEGACSGCSFVNPIYTYPHTPVGSGASIQSVVVYTGDTFGPSYRNKVFIADGTQGWIKELTFDPEFKSFISERMFDDRASNTVQLTQGEDGNIYQLTVFPNGELSRIAPAGGNRAPSAVITATPTYGLGPLDVTFSSEDSSDPDGGTLTYVWDFGDPSRTDDVSSNPNATWRYTRNGSYVVTLTVSDGAKVDQATNTVVVGSTPPVAQIQQVTTPRGDRTYHAGDTISFSALTGPGVDAQDGALPNSAYSWSVVFHHNTHIHPFRDNIVGPTGSFTIPRTPDQLDNTYYRITLTVTDSSGLSSTRSVDVTPRTVALTFNATNADGSPNPQATFTIDGMPFKGSYTETAVVGVQRVVSAPASQFAGGKRLVFANWSDGGALTHTITTPSTATNYTVAFDVAPVAPVVSSVVSSGQTGASPRGVAVSATKTYVANQGSNTVSVIDRANPTAAPVTIPVVGSPAAIALGPGGSNRAYVAGNNAVSVINTLTNQVIGSVTTGGGQSFGIAVSPNGQRVYVTTSGTSRLAVIDTTTPTPTVLTRVTVGSFPVGVAVSGDGSRVYVANYNNSSVSVIDAATLTVVGSRITVGPNPYGVAVGPNGRVYVANAGNGSVSVINTATATPSVSKISVGTQPAGVAISPDGSLLYVANGNDTVSIISTATNAVLSTVTIDTAPETQRHSIAVSPDGQQIYISDLADRTVRILTINAAPS